MTEPCYIGIDFGTSGCRAVAIDRERRIVADARDTLPEPVRNGSCGVEQDPALWREALICVLTELAKELSSYDVRALCVDGTSSTLLLCDPEGTPLGPALMYNDCRSQSEAERIAAISPETSPARGSSSSLAKLLNLKNQLNPRHRTQALHQTDWILGNLTGHFNVSDWNNCLKLGVDPQTGRWPGWLSGLGLDPVELPRVMGPGTALGRLSSTAARTTGLPEHTQVLAGTTDSTAAVVAAGAMRPGEAVTCLGSTLVIKIIGRKSVTAPGYGVYSHRFGARWLVGGASNSGGMVLRQYFDDRQIRLLSASLRPDLPTGLDYYPLRAPGERFPTNDPGLQPRSSPRPAEDARFLQGLLEGIAAIEVSGYRRLEELGAPRPTRILTTGGGAANQAWTRIRQKLLGIPVTSAVHQEAAYGTAIIALTAGVPTQRPRNKIG